MSFTKSSSGHYQELTGDDDDDDDDQDGDRHSLAKRIPFFGLLMSLLSVICFSLCSLIVKILTNLHALEILAIRCVLSG